MFFLWIDTQAFCAQQSNGDIFYMLRIRLQIAVYILDITRDRTPWTYQIDGLAQERHAPAMDLCLSCTNPLKLFLVYDHNVDYTNL